MKINQVTIHFKQNKYLGVTLHLVPKDETESRAVRSRFFLFNCHGFKPVAIEKKKSSTTITHASSCQPTKINLNQN
jgi:hypothetical protein